MSSEVTSTLLNFFLDSDNNNALSKKAKASVNCDSDKTLDGKSFTIDYILPSQFSAASPMGGSLVKINKVPSPSGTLEQSSIMSSFFDGIISSNFKNIHEMKVGITSLLYSNFFQKEIQSFDYTIPYVQLITGLTIPEQSTYGTKKICKMAYIPYEIIIEMISYLYQNDSAKAIIAGQSGIALNFSDHEVPKQSEDSLISNMLEFLPYYNIREDILNDIKDITPDIGGYFTIYNNACYFKLPDISGKTYRGEMQNFWSEDFKFALSFTFELPESVNVYNKEIQFIKPISAEVIEWDEEYDFGKESKPFEVLLSSEDLTGCDVYLSPLTDKNFSAPPNGFNDNSEHIVDYLSVPNSEIFIHKNESKQTPSIQLTLLQNYYDSIKSIINPIFLGEPVLNSFGLSGDRNSLTFVGNSIPSNLYIYPSLNKNTNSNSMFSWLARQDQILSSEGDKFNPKSLSVSSNYFSSKPMNSSIFAQQQTPRVYSDYHIPKNWIKGEVLPSTDGQWLAIFKKFSLNNFSFTSTPELRFSINLWDRKSNVYRVTNKVISVRYENTATYTQSLVQSSGVDYQSQLIITSNVITCKDSNEIPLTYDFDTVISFKSKLPVFSEGLVSKLKIIPYIIPKLQEDKKLIEFLSNEYTIIDNKYILYGAKSELDTNIFSNFSRITDKKATYRFNSNLNFPFLKLKDLSLNSEFGFVFTLESFENITTGNSLFCSVSVSKNHFSSSPNIISMCSVGTDFDGNQVCLKTFSSSTIPDRYYSRFNDFLIENFKNEFSSFKFSPIKINSGISKIVLFFYATSTDDVRQTFKFYIGGDRVYSSPKRLFKNIWAVILTKSISADSPSDIDVIVKRKDKRFGIELSSENAYVDITTTNSYSPFNLSGEDLVCSADIISSTTETSFLSSYIPFASPDYILYGNMISLKNSSNSNVPYICDFNEDIIYQLKGEAPNSFPSPSMENFYCDMLFYVESAYKSSLNDKITLSDISCLSGSTTSLSYLPLSFKIPNGTKFSKWSYATNGAYSGNYKIFNRLKFSNMNKISCLDPNILSVTPETFGEGEVVTIKVSGMSTKGIKVYIESLRAKAISVTDSEIKVIAPKGLSNIKVIDGKCQEIVLRPSSPNLLFGENTLGIKAINEKLSLITNTVNGLIGDGMGKINDLVEKVKDKFLKFISVTLDKANIPKELINSFCDMSFHLTLELNIYLKNFAVLLIPIKVIFCIIDVICSLLNPVKLAQAIIRLFDCLYELITLLPQISIPVMAFQLLLHLLELIECILTKVTNTIAIIAVLISSISELVALAKSGAIIDMKYLSILERILNENLLTIEADLQILGPVVQILSLFLQLLQLVFRFPCNIGPQTDPETCGIDGTLLAGMIIGNVIKEDKTIDYDYILPVAQVIPRSISEDFSDDILSISQINSAQFGDGESDVIYPTSGDSVISSGSNSFKENLIYDSETTRFSENNNVAFVASYTKCIKSFSSPENVKFLFKGSGEPGVFKKLVETNSPIDSSVYLLKKIGNSLAISSNVGTDGLNIFSMIDGKSFFTINGSRASVNPLEIPISVDGEEVIRKFEGLPSVVLMDENHNIYTIDEEGIVFDNDFRIKAIFAKIINKSSAEKISFNVSNETIDSTPEDSTDSEFENINVYQFPKLFFVDVRVATEDIQQQCATASVNNIILESTDPGDVSLNIEAVQICIDNFLSKVNTNISSIRSSLQNGELTNPFGLDFAENEKQGLISCINDSLSGLCRHVVNTLNTSFYIENGETLQSEKFPSLETSQEIMGDFQSSGPPFTGAREYAAGINTTITSDVSQTVKLIIIPRDIYNDLISKEFDLSKRIVPMIISDSGGKAEIVKVNDSYVEKNLEEYYFYIKSPVQSQVLVSAKICSQKIQAITYSGLETIIDEQGQCIVSNKQSEQVVPLGGLKKTDRILTINFIDTTTIEESEILSIDNNILTSAQPFGALI